MLGGDPSNQNIIERFGARAILMLIGLVTALAVAAFKDLQQQIQRLEDSGIKAYERATNNSERLAALEAVSRPDELGEVLEAVRKEIAILRDNLDKRSGP